MFTVQRRSNRVNGRGSPGAGRQNAPFKQAGRRIPDGLPAMAVTGSATPRTGSLWTVGGAGRKTGGYPPGWADYGAILANAPDVGGGDHTIHNSMEVYYNGADTIEGKTLYAKENLGSVIIWELTQDTSNPDKSLLQAIGRVIKQPR
mgnify:CR=1 FL=1